jgi:hypothetical protein
MAIYAVPKSKNHCGANYLAVTVISNRKCHEKCVNFTTDHNVVLILAQRLHHAFVFLGIGAKCKANSSNFVVMLIIITFILRLIALVTYNSGHGILANNF